MMRKSVECDDVFEIDIHPFRPQTDVFEGQMLDAFSEFQVKSSTVFFHCFHHIVGGVE